MNAHPAIPPLVSSEEELQRETERELVGLEPRSRYETAQVEDDIDREERDLERRIVEAPTLANDPEPQRNGSSKTSSPTRR